MCAGVGPLRQVAVWLQGCRRASHAWSSSNEMVRHGGVGCRPGGGNGSSMFGSVKKRSHYKAQQALNRSS